MKLRLDRPLVCLDFESTGVDPQQDRIVEIGLVRLSPDGRRESLQRRVDPGIDIPESATRIHGIRTDDVRGLFGEPPLARVADELGAFLADSDIVGFNIIGYDLPLWLTECERHGITFAMERRSVVDAKTIFDSQETGWDRFLQGPRNLNNAVLFYCGREQGAAFADRDESGDDVGATADIDAMNRHSAIKDADATLDVLLAQLERYTDLPTDVPGLHAYCEEAARERRLARGM